MNQISSTSGPTGSAGSANLDLERLSAGALGKFFGHGSGAAINIAGFVAGVALLGGIAITIGLLWRGSEKDAPYEIWKYLAPIVTGALGFIFGKQ